MAWVNSREIVKEKIRADLMNGTMQFYRNYIIIPHINPSYIDWENTSNYNKMITVPPPQFQTENEFQIDIELQQKYGIRIYDESWEITPVDLKEASRIINERDRKNHERREEAIKKIFNELYKEVLKETRKMITKEEWERIIKDVKKLKWNDMCDGEDIELEDGTNLLNTLAFSDEDLGEESELLDGFKVKEIKIENPDFDKSTVEKTIVIETPWKDYYEFKILYNYDYQVLERVKKVKPYTTTITKFK